MLLPLCSRVVSEQDERFSYFASVGVNAYITIQLSFLPESEKRSTRVAARTFCPDFDHHMEVSCDLLIQRSSGETCSLAEQLEEASAVFTVWNRESRKGLRKPTLFDHNYMKMLKIYSLYLFVLFVAAVITHKPRDVMMGTVKIPLADLVHKRTGMLHSL